MENRNQKTHVGAMTISSRKALYTTGMVNMQYIKNSIRKFKKVYEMQLREKTHNCMRAFILRFHHILKIKHHRTNSQTSKYSRYSGLIMASATKKLSWRWLRTIRKTELQQCFIKQKQRASSEIPELYWRKSHIQIFCIGPTTKIQKFINTI